MRCVVLIALLFVCTGVAAQQPPWPKTYDGELFALMDKEFIRYEHEPAYQNGTRSPGGALHTTKRNPGIPGRDPVGHANGEFPWSTAAGLHLSDNFKAIRFVHLPGAITWRGDWYRASGDTDYVITWKFPAGTVFVECLCVVHKGRNHLFQLRTRTKTAKGWVGKVYSPFQTEADVRKVTPILGYTGLRLKTRLDQPLIDKQQDLTEVGKADPAVLKDLVFKAGEGVRLTTRVTSIVPRNYVGVPAKCSTCHQTVLQHAFDLQLGRDWYGRVRGSDETFSFHIFDASSINHDGFNRPPRLNPELLKKGLLKPE